jgi:SPP1 gp7 family putative phage head morphogenesis protein
VNLIDRILTDLSGRYADPYFRAVSDLYVSSVRMNKAAQRDAFDRLVEATQETMRIVELVAAGKALEFAGYAQASMQRMAKGGSPLLFKDDYDQAVVPRVTFEDAVDKFVSRAPKTLTNAAERTWRRIAEVYTTENVAAFVRAAEQSVTKEAQSFITRALREGWSEGEAGRNLSMAINEIRELSAPWSQAYSRMVFRTNANTAVTQGRFRAVEDPDVDFITPAHRIDTMADGDVRDSHTKLEGLVFGNKSRAWSQLAPPLGYNCRCKANPVTRWELESEGHLRPDGSVIDSPIPFGAGPDEGFRPRGFLR